MRILSRVAAAILGGFIFASAVVAALPLLLPGSRVEWVLWSTLLGFALWTAAVVWVFAARSATRAWAGLAAATAIACMPIIVLAKVAAP